ncbi:hypothetical protein NDU88_004723 [Pleurodeles waltl]|uniref:Uncharacterized protein n=1 Tax=Pleurodeles waltl TaxID=8319 RepID=A0AAV7L0P3_PLEWA|nr:hypothetical protein NDU88_004723 [Pleurodeles waltl]
MGDKRLPGSKHPQKFAGDRAAGEKTTGFAPERPPPTEPAARNTTTSAATTSAAGKEERSGAPHLQPSTAASEISTPLRREKRRRKHSPHLLLGRRNDREPHIGSLRPPRQRFKLTAAGKKETEALTCRATGTRPFLADQRPTATGDNPVGVTRPCKLADQQGAMENSGAMADLDIEEIIKAAREAATTRSKDWILKQIKGVGTEGGSAQEERNGAGGTALEGEEPQAEAKKRQRNTSRSTKKGEGSGRPHRSSDPGAQQESKGEQW